MSQKPRKRFGQNFLQDERVIDQMVQAIHPQPQDALVEIGPGRGALTDPLISVLDKMDVIEIDRDLIPVLNAQFITSGKLTIHESDALKFDFANLIKQRGSLRIVGNLPYNISTPLMFYLLEQSSGVTDMHFLLQKEVVDRLAALPNTKAYGRLSVMMQYFCEVEPLFEVPPESFYPQPKVMSQFVRLTPKPLSERYAQDHQRLKELVTQSFSMRRKTLRNNLKKVVDVSQLESLGIDPGARPETLTLQDFVKMANELVPLGD